jgi:hypothetical protein
MDPFCCVMSLVFMFCTGCNARRLERHRRSSACAAAVLEAGAVCDARFPAIGSRYCCRQSRSLEWVDSKICSLPALTMHADRMQREMRAEKSEQKEGKSRSKKKGKVGAKKSRFFNIAGVALDLKTKSKDMCREYVQKSAIFTCAKRRGGINADG